MGVCVCESDNEVLAEGDDVIREINTKTMKSHRKKLFVCYYAE